MSNIVICGKPAREWTLVHSNSPVELFAASELVKYVSAITGDGFACDSENKIVLSLGGDGLVRDGSRIKASPQTLTIEGGGERGLIYAVYTLLEAVGVRFLMPDVEILCGGEIAADYSFEFNPPFEFRQSDWVCGADTAWSVKNRVNSRSIPTNMGGFYKWGSFVHTMTAIMGADMYKEQPCLSDPANLEKAIAYVHNMLKADPNINVISVSQNDNCNYCKCEKCQAVAAEEGSEAGILLRFVNAVADSVKDEYPDVAIETLAYQYTRKAPKITKPRDNVIVRLCSIECCFSHPLSDESCSVNAAFKADIEEWNKICDRLYIWDYVTDFSYYIPPFPNFGVLRENMRFFASHGVKGMYPEGNYQALSGEFGELRAYLLAKLMYDPFMSETKYQRHTNDFLAGYYGNGWRYIRAFIDFTVKEAQRDHMSIWSHPFKTIPSDMYIAMLPTIDAWWNAAEAEAGDKLENVKRSRLQWTYVKLMLSPDAKKGEKFLSDVKAYKVRWNEWRNYTDSVPDFNTTPDKWEV